MADLTARRRPPLAGALSRLRGAVPREPIDHTIDWLRFQLDNPGALAYQPLPWRDDAADDRDGASRADGTRTRWEAMLPLIAELDVRSAVDIGCNVAWFSVALGSMGIPTVGVEGHPPIYRAALYAVRRSGVPNVSVLAMDVRPDTAPLLPHADATLMLSVWHHLVRVQGLAAADAVLTTIWRNTRSVLFFESGEAEMGPEFGLPELLPTPRDWLEAHLARVCEGGRVQHLGMHQSGPGQERNLFAVVADRR